MYIERTDLVDRFGESEINSLEINITNSNDPQEKAKATASAIAAACSEIDSYIAARYVLPIPSVPDQLKHRACDIARYKLYKDQASEEVEKRYKEALSWLRDVSNKRAVLIFPDQPDQHVATTQATTMMMVV